MNKRETWIIPGFMAASDFHLAGGVLIEAGAGRRRLFGPWTGAFGCWEETGETLCRIVPAGTFIGAHGMWLDPPGPRGDGWYASRAAVAAYFATIPTAVRRLAARHRDQWAILEWMWQNPAALAAIDY